MAGIRVSLTVRFGGAGKWNPILLLLSSSSSSFFFLFFLPCIIVEEAQNVCMKIWIIKLKQVPRWLSCYLNRCVMIPRVCWCGMCLGVICVMVPRVCWCGVCLGLTCVVVLRVCWCGMCLGLTCVVCMLMWHMLWRDMWRDMCRDVLYLSCGSMLNSLVILADVSWCRVYADVACVVMWHVSCVVHMLMWRMPRCDKCRTVSCVAGLVYA